LAELYKKIKRGVNTHFFLNVPKKLGDYYGEAVVEIFEIPRA